MKHTEIALRRPVTTIMVYLALAMVGIISSRLLPLEEFPDISFPGMFIQIPYPGSTPEEVERRITRPIEEALATMSGIEVMESSSRAGDSEIRIFTGWEEDSSATGIEARAKIDGVRHLLPDDVQRIRVFTGSISDQPILALRISADRDLSDAYNMLDKHLKRRLERLDGVSRVQLEGVDPREIRILLDADRLAAHNIEVGELRTLLERSNFSVSAGRITESGQRFSVRPEGEFHSLEEIENIIIDQDNLRLSDVAKVELRSPDRNYGRHLDGRYSIGISVFKETGANMVDVADRVMEQVAEASRIPQMQGIRVFTLVNSADDVRKSLSDLLKSGLIGAILAIAVLYFFLRQLSTTLIVTLSVPFSLLITLAAMYAFGLTINILTMMGMMLAVGMLVDNAVVVTESIFRYRQMRPNEPEAATLAGVKEVGIAVIAGTATSIMVFVPIIFGTKVDITVFLTHVAITISVALLASLVIAQTLVPMLAARLPPATPPAEGSFMTRFTERYAGALEWTLRHRWWTLLGIVLVVLSGAIPMNMIRFDTFPQESSRRLFMPYHIEGSHPLPQIEAAVDKVEAYLLGNKDQLNIRSVYSYYDQGRAESTILLTEEAEATLPTKEIVKRIEEEVPEIIIGEPSFKFDQEGGTEGFSVQLLGDSTEELWTMSSDVKRALSRVEGLSGLYSDASAGEQELSVIIDRNRAMQVGLSVQEIASSLASAMRGDELREFRGRDGDIAVRLAFRDSDKQSMEDLAGLPLYAASGERITLGSVARFERHKGPQTIERKDRATAVVISGNLDDDTSMEDIRPRVTAIMEQMDLPPGYSWKFGRGFDEEDETQQLMLTNILLGVAMIFIVMAALFESTLYPISIITSILFSVVGVFWFFLVTDTTFSFMASIGIMILIGVVVNNGIVLIDHVNNLRVEGMPRDDAILQAGKDRIRPILMTVATTVLGLTPLAIGSTEVGSTGAPYFPMARAIIGGLLFSTVMSLLVVPTVYVWVDELNRWARKVGKLSRSHARTPTK